MQQRFVPVTWMEEMARTLMYANWTIEQHLREMEDLHQMYEQQVQELRELRDRQLQMQQLGTAEHMQIQWHGWQMCRILEHMSLSAAAMQAALTMHQKQMHRHSELLHAALAASSTNSPPRVPPGRLVPRDMARQATLLQQGATQLHQAVQGPTLIQQQESQAAHDGERTFSSASSCAPFREDRMAGAARTFRK